MRAINILTEDYIQLESILGNNENAVYNELTKLRYQIDEAISAYENTDKDTSAYMALRYSPIFEQLTSVRYRTELANICKKLYNETSMPLSEAYTMSCVFMEEDRHASKNDMMDAAYCFGSLNEADIPATTNGDYSVSYTNAGRNNLIKHIAKLQESITTAYENLKSIDSAVIHDSLYTLADAYMLVKGN